MPAGENVPQLRSSILDRLIDRQPELSQEPVRERQYTVSQVKKWLVRDLENLLNTRRNILAVPDAYSEVQRSLYTYGLSDFTAQNPKSPAVRGELRADIELAVSRFEPRLKDVTVEIVEELADERNLVFRISALLVMEPLEELVTFDTYFDVNRGEVVINR